MTNQPSGRSGTETGVPERGTPRCAPDVGAARARAEQLLAAFLADPGGEAGQVARTMLLNYMVKEQTQQEEQALRELQEHRGKRALLEGDVGTLAVKRLNADARNQKLGEALRQARAQHGKIGQYVCAAQKALAEKKPFDYDRALKQISAVIGVGRPMKYRVKSAVEGMNGYELTEEEMREYKQGRGPAWEEEQRRLREHNKN